MEDGHCCRTVHAEANAILQAAKNGTAIAGATLYSTASPCWPCFGLVANSGIERIVFGEAYRAEDPGPKRVAQIAKLLGIEFVALEKTDLSDEDQKRAEERTLACLPPRVIGFEVGGISIETPKVTCSRCGWTGFKQGNPVVCPVCTDVLWVS